MRTYSPLLVGNLLVELQLHPCPKLISKTSLGHQASRRTYLLLENLYLLYLVLENEKFQALENHFYAIILERIFITKIIIKSLFSRCVYLFQLKRLLFILLKF